LQGPRLRRFGIAASVVLLLTAVVLAIVGGSGGDSAPTTDTSPHLVDVDVLTSLEGELGHSLFWVGERQPDRLELTEEAAGSVYLRYLPPGVAAGDRPAAFLTVGTYQVPDAQAAIRRTAVQAGTPVGRLAAGGLVLANPASEGSVYLAYPGSDLEIEVYDPQLGRAMRLIRSGAVRGVGE
jgi:hypothetical protein